MSDAGDNAAASKRDKRERSVDVAITNSAVRVMRATTQQRASETTRSGASTSALVAARRE